MPVRSFKWIIAIDPGVTNGVAFWNGKELTLDQWDIPELFLQLNAMDTSLLNGDIFFIIEDARKTRRPKTVSTAESQAKAQGAGWVRTLCGVIETYLNGRKIPHRMVKPARRTLNSKGKMVKAMGVEEFKKLTGITTLKTESHKRDAGILAWNHPLQFFVS